MNALPILTRVGISDEAFEKVRSETLVEEMMDDSISDACFVNVSWFRVIDLESVVGTMYVGFRFQRLMKVNEVIHEMQSKLLDVFFLLLAFAEVLPS